MRREAIEQLDALFRAFPVLLGGAAPQAEIDAAQVDLGRSFDADYREFLERYGGAIVGSLPVLRLRTAEVMGERETLLALNRHYRAQQWPHADEWTIISTDGRGNPIGLATNGQLWTWDHDVRARLLIAPSFEAFLLQLLRATPDGGGDTADAEENDAR